MAIFGNFVGKKDLELTNEFSTTFYDLYRTLYGLY